MLSSPLEARPQEVPKEGEPKETASWVPAATTDRSTERRDGFFPTKLPLLSSVREIERERQVPVEKEFQIEQLTKGIIGGGGERSLRGFFSPSPLLL